AHQAMTPEWFQDVLARLQFSEQRLAPSWWLSSGLLEAAHPTAGIDGRPAWIESLLFLAVLLANGLMMQLVAAWVAARLFRQSYSSLRSASSGHKRPRAAW